MVVAISQKQEIIVKTITSSIYMNVNETMIANESDSLPELCAHAIFSSDAKSHPFVERYLALNQPIRIGRVICSSLPTSRNLIFNCKVMSRNHALFWFDNGKFFLKDLESSNGTYINDVKLTSLVPHEIHSGDIIQFGINVTDNSNSHDSIVGTFKLFPPDYPIDFSDIIMKDTEVSMDQLNTLNIYLQEALQRECELESKMNKIHEYLEKAEKTTDFYWNSFINEDKLYSTIESLELRLSFYLRTFPNDELKIELDRLKKEKDSLVSKSKETLLSLHLQRLSLQEKCDQLQVEVSKSENQVKNLSNLETEREANYLKLLKVYDTSQKQIMKLRNELNESKLELEKKKENEILKKSIESDFVKLQNRFVSLINEKEQFQNNLNKIQEEVVHDMLNDNNSVANQNNLEDSIKKLQNSLRIYEQQIKCNLRYLNSLSKKINDNNNDINDFNLNSFNQSVSCDETLLNGYNNQESYNYQIKELENFCENHEKILSTINELTTKVDGLENTIENLKNTGNHLKSALKNEREKNKELVSEIDKLNEKLKHVLNENEMLAKNILFNEEKEEDDDNESVEEEEYFDKVFLNNDNDLDEKIQELENEIELIKEKLADAQSRNRILENALEELQKKCTSSKIEFSSNYYFFYVIGLFVISYLLNVYYFQFS